MSIIKTDHISLFWFRPGENEGDEETVIPLDGRVSIEEIQDPINVVGFAPIVTFYIRPGGVEFIQDNLVGRIEARHAAIPLGNPFAGELLCTISHMSPIGFKVNRLTTLDDMLEELIFEVEATCRTKWPLLGGFFEENDGN